MDPQQNNDGWEPVTTQAPPGQGQQPQQQQQSPTTSASNDGWEPVPQQQQPAHNDEIKITSPWYTPTGIAQRAGSVMEGAGEGLFSTAAGAGDLVDKATGMKPGGISKELHTLAGDDNTPGSSSAYNKVGYGGETLTEFLMGDEALKGLSQSDKLGTVSKWMKIAEKSPRLIQALRTGADVEKVGAEAGLSPEAIQFIRNNPAVAKYISIGFNALRSGTVQGTQTLVRSGGDVKKAAGDAIGTAVTGAALGTVAHGAASVLRKGGKAAQTISAMNDVAANAPTANEVQGGLSDTVNNAFNKETGTLQNSLDDSTSQVGMFGEGAPQQSQITQAAQKAAKTGKQAVHDQYQAGLDHLVGMAGDSTIPHEGSPLQLAAKEALAETPQTAGPLDKAFGVAQPGSPKANSLLERLADPTLGAADDAEEVEPSGILGPDGKPIESAPQEAEPAELNMQHLVARRQSLSNMIRNLGPNDRADRAIYGKLLNGVDDTIAKLADSVPDEGAEEGGENELASGEGTVDSQEPQKLPSAARQHFDAMNQAYRNGIRPFQNRDVKNVLSGKLNDVAKSIMGGQTSLADINDVKQAVGPQNFQAISKASLQNIVQSFMDDGGELDYKKLFSKFSKMNPDVRSAMFGDQGQALSDALKVANNSSNGLSEIGKQVNSLLGNGSIDTLMKDPDRVKQISNLVGPDGMKTLGRSIMDNQIKQASTVLDSATGTVKPSNFDPDKVLDWWMGMKDSPEVRDAFFSVDKDTAKQYNQMMQDLGQASSVKKLIKYGVLPLTMGTAGVVHGPGAALFGAIAGLGIDAGFGRARDILDAVANNPRTWKTLSFGGKAADKASQVVPQAARNASAAAVYKGVQGALSGNNQ